MAHLLSHLVSVLFLILLVVIAGVALRATSPAERARLFQFVQVEVSLVKAAAARSRPERDRFRDALRARTRWPIVTPLLAATLVLAFFYTHGSGASFDDPETLIAWGANFAPRTTNGEWWRLITSMFIHPGLLQLLINVAGLVQAGLIVERLVGRLAVAGVYFAAGVLASLVSLWTYPVAASCGASGAIFGIYGLLIVCATRSIFRRSDITIPLPMVTRIAPPAALFLIYNAVNDNLQGPAELTALAVGLVYGLMAARGVTDRLSEPREVGRAVGVAAAIALIAAVPVHGTANVKPEIERVISLEDRTAESYRKATLDFRNNRLTSDGLAQVIDRSIVPELQESLTHLKALEKVPPEHAKLLADAKEFLTLRCESWRLRAESLRKSSRPQPKDVKVSSSENARLRAEAQHRANNLAMGKAEGTERAALEVLDRLKSPDGDSQKSQVESEKSTGESPKSTGANK